MNNEIIKSFLTENYESISRYILKKFSEDIRFCSSNKEKEKYYVLLGKIDWGGERYNDVIKIIQTKMQKFGIKNLKIYAYDNRYSRINDLFLKTATHIYMCHEGYMFSNNPEFFYLNKQINYDQDIIFTKENQIKLMGIARSNKSSILSTPISCEDNQKQHNFILEVEDNKNNSSIFSVILDKQMNSKTMMKQIFFQKKINKDFIVDSIETLNNFQDINFKVRRINSVNKLLNSPVLKDLKFQILNNDIFNKKSYNIHNRELKLKCYKNIIEDLKDYINNKVDVSDILILTTLLFFYDIKYNDIPKLRMSIDIKNKATDGRISSIEISTRCLNYKNKSKMKLMINEQSLDYHYVEKIGEIIKCIGEYFDNEHFSKIVDDYKKQRKEISKNKKEFLKNSFAVFKEKKSLEYIVLKSKVSLNFDDLNIIKLWEVTIDEGN